MYRPQSRASLLLFTALRMAVCQPAGFILTPLQEASITEQLFRDLRLPQVPTNPFVDQDVLCSVGSQCPTEDEVSNELLDAVLAFPNGQSDEGSMINTLEDIDKDAAKTEDDGEEDAGVGGRRKRETGKGQLETKREATLLGPKRAPDFHSWGGKRSNGKNKQADLSAGNSLWGGKRAPDFNSWGGKRAPAFNSWGGKRSPAFNSWGGKRAPEFNSWGGKRAPEFNSWGGKRAPEFNSWGGKRALEFNSWGGKRAPEFNSWGGKRTPAFNSWGGKRSPAFNSWGGKRAPEFNSWGGKRAPEFNSWGGKRAPEFNSWGGKRSPAFNSWGGKRAPDFNSWGGKRSTHPSDEMINEQQLGSTTEETADILLEDILQNPTSGERSSPWSSLVIKKRSVVNKPDSTSHESFRKSRAADFYSWGG